jgi:hypothetical protein
VRFRKLTSILATGLLGASLGLAVASPAQATTCNVPAAQNVDDGYAVMLWGAHLKNAPYADCGNIAWLPVDTKIWIWCTVSNQYGNLWFYGRVAGTSTYGWMSANNVGWWTSPISNQGRCNPFSV